LTVDSCDIQAEYGGVFPTDASLHPLESNIQMATEIHMTAVNAPIKIDVKIQLSVKEIITPVKK